MDLGSILTWLFSGATVLSLSGKFFGWLVRSWEGDVKVLTEKVRESDKLFGVLADTFGEALPQEFTDVAFRLRYPRRVKLARRLFQIDEQHVDRQPIVRLVLGSVILGGAAALTYSSAHLWSGIAVAAGGVIVEFPYFREMVRRERALATRAREEADRSLKPNVEEESGSQNTFAQEDS